MFSLSYIRFSAGKGEVWNWGSVYPIDLVYFKVQVHILLKTAFSNRFYKALVAIYLIGRKVRSDFLFLFVEGFARNWVGCRRHPYMLKEAQNCFCPLTENLEKKLKFLYTVYSTYSIYVFFYL